MMVHGRSDFHGGERRLRIWWLRSRLPGDALVPLIGPCAAGIWVIFGTRAVAAGLLRASGGDHLQH